MRAVITLTILFFITPCSPQSRHEIVKDPIAFFLPKSAQDTTEYDNFATRRIVRCTCDFNNDGLTDVAVSDEGEAWGNAGGDWEIFLRQKDGTYKALGDIFFHPFAINVISVRPGIGKVTVYIRGGGAGGDFIEYFISDSSITKGQVQPILWGKPDSAAEKRYASLFQDSKDLPTIEYAKMRDLFMNRNVIWKPGY